MFVGDRVRITALQRPAPEDRNEFLDREGDLVMRLNVPWEPDLGALWQVRFPDGAREIFSESELAVLDGAGNPQPSEINDIKEVWGVAPRAASRPMRRPSSAGQAVLAFLAFSMAGVLLIWVGIAQQDMRIAAAGGALILLGAGAATVLVS